MTFDNNLQQRPHDSPASRLYRGGVTVSTVCLVLTVALVFAGMYGFNAPYGKPWCSGHGLPVFSGTGFGFLVLSLLSAGIALRGKKKSRRGAVICLVVSMLGLPLFGLCSFVAAFGCAG